MTELWVLGSKNNRANKCVDWETSFPDFLNADILIINLNTLRTALKENFTLKNALFNKVQRYIFDMLMTADKQVMVVMPTAPSDMTWLPIYPDCRFIAPTKTEKASTDQALYDYLENVEATDYYFDGMKFAFINEKKPEAENTKVAQEYYSTKLRRTFDILNTAKQLVGGAFRIVIELRQTYLGSLVNEEQFVSNPIMFLPPPTKVSIERGIDTLIGTIISKTSSYA